MKRRHSELWFKSWSRPLLLVAIGLMGMTARAEDDDPKLFSFEAGAGNAKVHGRLNVYKDFSSWGGKALADGVAWESITPTPYGSFLKWLPTGATNQAVAFDSAGKIPPDQGAFSIWVTGKSWDVSAPGRETLVVIEGEDATVSLERSQPKMLSVVSTTGGRIDASLDKVDPNRMHQLAVCCDGKKTTLFIDMQPAGSAEGLTMPQKPKRLVVGQLGEGPGTNKRLEMFYTYRRPLSQGEITAAFFRESNPILPRLVTIPKRTQPVTIDGLMDEDAWKGAAALAGMTHSTAGGNNYELMGEGRLSEVEDRIFLMYDDENLYVGYHNPAPKSIRGNAPMVAAMMKCSKPGFDTNVDADDSFFIRARNPYPHGDDYRMWVNRLNTHYDWTRGMGLEVEPPAAGARLKGIDINWNPAWKTKSTLDLDGWHIEASIPLKDFQNLPPAAPGTEWRMEFARFWRTTLAGMSAWEAGIRRLEDGGMVEGGGLGRVRFGKDGEPAVQLQSVGDLNAGAVDLRAELVNPSAQPLAVTVQVTTNTGELADQKKVELGANERKAYALAGRIKNFATGLLNFRVLDAAGKELFLTALPVVRSDKVDIYAYKYPSLGLLKYEVGALSLAQYPEQDLELRVKLLNGKGKECFAKTTKGLKNYSATVEVKVKDWPSGDYRIQFSFRRGGKELEKAEMVYTKKDLPEWYGNRIGCDGEHPPFPWNDIKTGENQVVVGSGPQENRQVDFGKSAFPEKIFTQGRAILRAPMTLHGVMAEGGAFTTKDAKAESTWTKKTNVRVEGQRKAAGTGLAIANEFWMEYDGFCWMRMVLQPSKKATLQSLVLEIPFTKEFSDVMNCNDYSIQKNGRIPPNGVTHAPALPIWVGNAVGGLQFFVDTTGPWSVKEEASSIRLENGPEGATLKVTMVDVPKEIEGRHAIEVGFTVTPVKDTFQCKIKPLADGLANAWGYCWYPGGDGSGDWMPAHSGWETWRFSCIRWDYVLPGWNHSGPYSNFNMIPTHSTDQTGMEAIWDFADEWVINPSYRFRQGVVKPTNPDLMSVSFHSPSYRDWLVWKHHRLFEKTPYRCMYHDVSHVVPSANPYAGAGYVKPDGGRVSSLGLLEIRDLYKRLYHIMGHYYPEGANSVFHSSGMPNMAYESFGGRFWTDENLNSRVNDKQPTYRGLITADKFRAEYMGLNFGNVCMMIGQGRISAATCFEYGVDAIYDHIKGLCLLHGMEKGSEGFHIAYAFGGKGPKSVAARLQERDEQALHEHNIYSPAYRFVPYWDQKTVQAPNQDTYVSYYQRKDAAKRNWDYDGRTGPAVVFLVWNESNSKGELRLPVDWKALGFDPAKPMKANNLVHRVGLKVTEKDPSTQTATLYKKTDETAKVDGGQLVFPITEWNYRMIAVTQPE